MATRRDPDEPVMLTLAGLTYRGFSDLLLGEAHEYVVRRAVLNGLEAVASVRGDWELVWGPVTSRLGDRFDASAMYVVCHWTKRQRYVVAVRGTNPLSLTDWFFGDFNVATTVAWPFAEDAAMSTATAFGLRTLLGLAWSPPPAVTRIADHAYEAIRDLVAAFWTGIQELVRGAAEHRNRLLRAALEPIEAAVARWIADVSSAADLPQRVARLLAERARVEPDELRPRRRSPEERQHSQNLFEFLSERAAASREPLEVIVTGHSKGGALAPALALWLAETRRPGTAGAPGWDGTGEATVGCVSFAGPTPGNAAFASRVRNLLGDRCRRVVNHKDVVTHAWKVDELAEITELYGSRSRPLAALVDEIAHAFREQELAYRHPDVPAEVFSGKIDASRSFADELVYQHMDAYIRHAGLPPEVDALTFFLG